MKRVKNSDIKFKINKKLVYLPNFVIRFYTVNQKEYFFEKTQDDLVEYEREATVDDVEVILSGGTTVTEYYLPLNWSELLFVGQGILNYKLTNNIEDPEFPDYQYNKEEVVTTDFYIDSIKVDPEPEEGLIERVVHLEEHLAEEIVNREEADAAISGAVDSEIARALSAETALQEAIDDEIERAISAETAIVDALEEEANRAISAETALDTKIDQEIADRIADVNTEEARAISAETALDAKIDAETNRATSAETALQTAINDEATARANADTALQTAITTEESRAREAESGITNALNAEVTRATGAENALDDKIDAETTRATGAEAALDAKIGTVSGNVITEEARAKGVEDVLSGAIDTIDAKFIDDAKYEMSGQTHVINFYNGSTIKATIDCTDFLVDGMIDDVYIENGYLVIDFNTASGKQDIRIPLTDIFNPANYYTKSETSGATEIANALALKLNISDFNTYSGNVATALSEKASQSTVDALSGVVTAHTADDSIHLTTSDVQSQIDNSISGKVNVSDNIVSAYSFDKSTKIEYIDAAALREPSIPNGTKKISISFTMLPENNQLFENLQFVTFNPFGIVDVASGLTVGVAEDTSTFPFTYTITSVTIADSNIIGYDLSENDTLLNLYALGDYQLIKAKPNGYNMFNVYFDVLEDIESGQTAEVVNDGVIKNFENVGKYLQNERNRVDNKIDNKLDATAYTPVVSSIMQGSTNPVEGGTLWDELRVQTSPGEGETTITFDSNNYSTNYPLGCTSLKVNVGAVDEFVIINFYNSSNTNLGEIDVANFGGIEVKRNTLPGATYEISGNVVTLSYPAQGIVKIKKRYSENFSFSAVNPPVYATLKNVVDGKQDTLSAGTGISIIDNVISATGGGGGGTVESAITSGSSNAVESSAIWSATTYNKEVTLQWDNGFPSNSTNYPSGCKKFVVTVPSNNTAAIFLCNGGSSIGGNIIISNYSSLSVTINGFDGITYTISGNDVTFVVPDTITFDQLQTDTRWITSIKAIVEGAWIADNTYMKSEVDAIQNALQNSINEKLDATAYTPVTIDSAVNKYSDNPLKNSALFDELRIASSDTGTTDITISFDGGNSTNYPIDCRQVKVELNSNAVGDLYFKGSNGGSVGRYNLMTFGTPQITNYFNGSTYELSGSTLIISYPSVSNVARLNNQGANNAYSSVAAVMPNYTYVAVVDQVSANTTALALKADSSDVYLKTETSGATEIATALSGKQDTLIAGENITISGNVISATGGGSDINVVQTTGTSTTDVMSQNAVTTKLNTKLDSVRVEPKTPTSNYTQLNLYLEKGNGGVQSLFTYVKTINGKSITSQNNDNLEGFSLIETSAITTSVTSASTDSQIPSAKAVYNALGSASGGITSGEVQTMIDQSISGKTNQTDFVSHSGNTSIHVTTAQTAVWDAKSDFSGSYNDLTDKPTIPNYTAGSGITISNNVISAKIWSGTQAQYDALAVKDNDTIYLIYNS